MAMQFDWFGTRSVEREQHKYDHSWDQTQYQLLFVHNHLLVGMRSSVKKGNEN
jgi:hypothetical protein